MRRPGIHDVGLVACLVLLAVIALRPSGVLGGRLQAWRVEREVLGLYRAEGAEAAATRGSTLGNGAPGDDAPVIFEFSDYACRFCRASHETVSAWAAAGEARIVLVHVPLSERSGEAARAAVCAEEGGAFPRLHDHLMTTDAWQAPEVDWASVAEAADVPAGTRFARCMASDVPAERLARDSALAIRWRVAGTPTFVSAHARIVGRVTAADLDPLLGR